MTDCLVFNHHSLPFIHQDAAQKSIPNFLKTCIKAKNCGFKTILVDQIIDKSWFRLELAPGYFLQDWYEQCKNDENRDEIRAFRSIVTQSPFFNSNDITEGADLFEVSLNGYKNYSALSAAAWHGSPIVSFGTREPWILSPLYIIISRLNQITSEIENDDSEIYNLYHSSVLERFLPELQARRNASLESGKEIVDRFNELYPGVLLCGKATQQLSNWSGSLTVLDQVKQALTILSEFTQRWQNFEIQDYRAQALRDLGLAFQVSGESQTVRNAPRLRREREFWLPSGKQEFFEQHIKLSFGYRFHFFPDSPTRQIYLGYIGPHLRLR